MSFTETARPFLTLHVGQAGVQIGNAIWELLCLEHNIQQCGLAKPDCPSNGFYDAMFLRSQRGHFMPRSIFLDTDPTSIDEIRVGPYRELFSKQQLLSDHTDARFNYIRGRRGFNRRLLPEAVERFRWLSEKSDVTPTAFLIHSIGGGTGSGLAASYLERLSAEFDSRLQVLELSLSSGHSGLQNTCEMINSMLYGYESKDYTTMSFSVTNSAMFNICRSGLGVAGGATFAHVNRMLAMCFSNLTAMDRFPGTLMCNVGTICSNLLPFWQLKNPILACAPFTAASSMGKERLSAIGVTSSVMEPDSQLADIDLRQGKHVAGVLIYRGAVKPSDIDQALHAMRERGRVEFVDWAPKNFKTGLTELPPLAVPNSGIAGTPLSVTLISNHTSVASLFRGQSEAIKKLVAAGNCFMRSYETGAAGSAGESLSASHNSGGVVGLLKEACDHLDGMAETYTSEKPPDAKGGTADSAPARRQVLPPLPKPKAAAAGPRRGSFGREAPPPVSLGKTGRMRQDNAAVVVHGAGGGSSPVGGQVAVSSGESSRFSSAAAEHRTAIGDERTPLHPLDGGSTSRTEQSFGPRTQLSSPYEEKALDPSEAKPENRFESTSIAPSVVAEGRSAGTERRFGPRTQLSSPNEEKALAPSEAEPENRFESIAPSVVAERRSAAENRFESITPSGAPVSPEVSTVTHGQQSFSTPSAFSEGTTPPEQSDEKVKKQQQKKSCGSCCGKRRDKAGTSEAHPKDKARPKGARSKNRSQSQNHANSFGARSSYHFVYNSGSSSQDDILVGTRGSCSHLHYCATHSSEQPIDDALDNESVVSSVASTDCATDLDEIIRDCQPGPMPTISSVRMMVQKYNNLLGNEYK